MAINIRCFVYCVAAGNLICLQMSHSRPKVVLRVVDYMKLMRLENEPQNISSEQNTLSLEHYVI